MTFTDTLRRRWPWFTSAAVAVLALLFAGALWAGLFDSDEPESAPVAAPTTETTTPSPEPEATPAIEIASVKEMPYTPVWNPPDGGQHFWQVVDAEQGYPKDGGTDFVLAHACRDRECVGDQIRTLEKNDRLTYLGDAYEVQEKIEIHKSEIADQDIWFHDENRLVIITCIINPETGTWDENDIIIATRAS